MKYCITYSFRARYSAEVEADSLEEAMEKAEIEYCDADFGMAKDIDGNVIFVEDENGKCIWAR